MSAQMNLPPAESTSAATDRLAELTAMMKPGFNRLPGNEPLEIAYLRYQAAVLDERYGDHVFRVDQLPDHEREQAQGLVNSLAEMGLASPGILQERLNRIRVLAVETHTSRFDGEVGGEFKNGLAIVAEKVKGKLRSDEQINHALVHEIGHGLSQPGEIAVFADDRVADFGGGLMNKKLLTKNAAGLKLVDESIIDTLAFTESDIDQKAFFAGEFPGFAYYEEDVALARLTTDQPDVARAMWEATFSKGLASRQQGELFALAYLPYLGPQ
jgi:hypothetical protein